MSPNFGPQERFHKEIAVRGPQGSISGDDDWAALVYVALNLAARRPGPDVLQQRDQRQDR